MVNRSSIIDHQSKRKVLEDVREAGARELSQVTTFDTTPDFARETVEASCKYMNYMDRQVKEMEGWRRNQEFRCGAVGGGRESERESLATVRRDVRPCHVLGVGTFCVSRLHQV